MKAVTANGCCLYFASILTTTSSTPSTTSSTTTTTTASTTRRVARGAATEVPVQLLKIWYISYCRKPGEDHHRIHFALQILTVLRIIPENASASFIKIIERKHTNRRHQESYNAYDQVPYWSLVSHPLYHPQKSYKYYS